MNGIDRGTAALIFITSNFFIPWKLLSEVWMVGRSRRACQCPAVPHPKSHPGAIAPSRRSRTEKLPPEGRDAAAEPMRIRERYELEEEVGARYRRAGRRERGQLLTFFGVAAGYGRKYAIRTLRGRKRVRPKRRAPRAKRYRVGFRAALKVCSEASDYLCAERLQSVLADLALILERHGRL